MKLLNWAKEKLQKLGAAVYTKQHGEEQRFHKTAPIVQAPDRKKRSQTRKARRFTRWYTMPTLHGSPVLTGLRLLRTMSNCTGIPLSFIKTMTPEARMHWAKSVYEDREKLWPRRVTNMPDTEINASVSESVPVVKQEQLNPTA